MEVSKYIEQVRKELDEELEAKTSWGRNELKMMFERTLTNVLAKNVDKLEGTVLKRKRTKTTVTTSSVTSLPKHLKKRRLRGDK